jgi:hypothetical protein
VEEYKINSLQTRDRVVWGWLCYIRLIRRRSSQSSTHGACNTNRTKTGRDGHWDDDVAAVVIRASCKPLSSSDKLLIDGPSGLGREACLPFQPPVLLPYLTQHLNRCINIGGYILG